VERRIVAEWSKRDARVLVNIAFADLDEPAEFGETREAHRDRIPGKCVENDVHSFAISYLHHRLSKIAESRVDYVFHSECFEQSTLTPGYQRWRLCRSKVKRDLDGGHSDSTSRPREQGRARPRVIAQRFAARTGGHENDRQRELPPQMSDLLNRSHIARARYRVSGNSEDGETEHDLLSDVRNVRANCFDDAAHFVAKNMRIRSIAWIKCQRLEHVTEIHSRCFDFN
jgi:hypothetical protein